MSTSQQDRLLLVPPALKRLSPDSCVWNPLPLTSPEVTSSWHSSLGTGQLHSSQDSFLHCQEATPRHLALSERPPRSTIGGVVSQFNLLHVRNRKSAFSCIGNALGKLARRLWRHDCRTAQLIEESNLGWGEVALDDFYVEQTVQEDNGDWASLDGGELAFCQLDECSSRDFSDVDLASDANRNSESPPPLPRHLRDVRLKTDDAKSKSGNSDCVSSAQRCSKVPWRRCKSLHHLRSRLTVRVQKKMKPAGGHVGNVPATEQSIPFRVERVGDSLEPTLVFSCGSCSPKAAKKRKRRVKMVEGVVRRILSRRPRAVKYLVLKREAKGNPGDDWSRETDTDNQFTKDLAPLVCADAKDCAFSLCDGIKNVSLCVCDGAKESVPLVCDGFFSPFVNHGTKESPRFESKDLSPTLCDRNKYLTPVIWHSAQDLCLFDARENGTKTQEKQLEVGPDATVHVSELSSPCPDTERRPTPESFWMSQSLRRCGSSQSLLTFPETTPRPENFLELPPLTSLSSFSPSCSSTPKSIDLEREGRAKGIIPSQSEHDMAEERGAEMMVGTVDPGPLTSP